jgi:arginyl-tRNA synthetase
MKEKVISALSKKTKIPKEQLENLVEIPPNSILGDYAFPCFILAKKHKKNPSEIASSLASKIKAKDFEKVESKGPYVNFFLNKIELSESVLKEILKKKKDYGRGDKKGKVALEHTSINPNASPHVGRARNSIIGDSLKRILEFSGYNVETYYYVNDVSKQIALIALFFKGNESFEDLLKLYIEANKKLKQNPEIENSIFELLGKFEAGDKKTKALFKKITQRALKGQTEILKDFGITFDKFDNESGYIQETKPLIEKFKKNF